MSGFMPVEPTRVMNASGSVAITKWGSSDREVGRWPSSDLRSFMDDNPQRDFLHSVARYLISDYRCRERTISIGVRPAQTSQQGGAQRVASVRHIRTVDKWHAVRGIDRFRNILPSHGYPSLSRQQIKTPVASYPNNLSRLILSGRALKRVF